MTPGEQIQIEIFRRMTPADRLACSLRWTGLTCALARGAIRAGHPDWTDMRVDQELGRRITGIDIAGIERRAGAPPIHE
jgi:hypothetical protein